MSFEDEYPVRLERLIRILSGRSASLSSSEEEQKEGPAKRQTAGEVISLADIEIYAQRACSPGLRSILIMGK